MKAGSVKSAAGFGGKALTFALTAYILALMSLRCKKTDTPNTTGYYHDLPGGPRGFFHRQMPARCLRAFVFWEAGFESIKAFYNAQHMNTIRSFPVSTSGRLGSQWRRFEREVLYFFATE